MNHIPATVLAAIDTIAAGLAKQRKQSFSQELDMCAYRTADGCKCALGWLIPDPLYTETMEGLGADSILSAWGPLLPWSDELQGDGTCQQLNNVLSSFQRFHDSVSNFELGTALTSYKALLKDHANDPDEVLESSIKRALIYRAESAYGVSHEPA